MKDIILIKAEIVKQLKAEGERKIDRKISGYLLFSIVKRIFPKHSWKLNKIPICFATYVETD